ncbi:MAG: SUMF1/EgtB/PvdO family nonheme iron enzyme [Planctomycetota bacterium]|nr:SUMF1/EgtB/PvdO family nonheme iron enzyme [Planctomycetota bacterium]
MKNLLLTIVIAFTAISTTQAQTLQIDPLYVGGTAYFEVQNGAPDATAIICYSINGSGPFSFNNGITLDLSMPIKSLNPFILDSLGNGNLGPFPLPSNAVVGMQVWFQGVQLNMWTNPIYSVTNMVPVTVQTMPNNPPTAVDDSYSVDQDTVTLFDVMSNDSDPDGDVISLFSVSGATNGNAVIVGGSIEYTPVVGFVGNDSFTYQLADAFGAQDSAVVDVVVLSTNNPPVAADDNASVNENSVVMINAMGNDSDPDGDVISIVSVNTPLNGTALIVSGQIEYTPLLNYVGSDSFTYVLEDYYGLQDTATVFVDVVGSVPTDMVAIAGGTFDMGDHAGVGSSNEQPVHTVTLDAFYMDKYEVSNVKFADFLNNSTVSVSGTSVYQVGGAGQRICYLNYGLNHNGTTFGIDAGKDNHPVVNVTWYGATLYCNYLSTANGRTPCYDETTFACDFAADGFRLPTEAEWEYASRGGEHNPYYQYPWGSNSITSNDANYYNNGPNTTVDVGSYAANGYGLYDMAGNVWEWCNDWYDSGYYANSPTSNPTGAASGSNRVLRGGSWSYSATYLRCAFRSYYNPTTYNFNAFGFRVLAVQ